jgi:hypothetical protein
VTIALIRTLALLAPAAAYGASVTFTDPDDFEVAPDVHRTTRTTYATPDGRRVRLGVRGELGPDYRLRVLLDTRGDGAADDVMVATVWNLELVNCLVRNVRGARSTRGAGPIRSGPGGTCCAAICGWTTGSGGGSSRPAGPASPA